MHIDPRETPPVPSTHANGTQISYQITHAPPDGSARRLEPVVLISGAGHGGAFWRAIRPHLEPHLAVITLDNRGFGGSGGAGKDYAVEMMARDVLAVMAAAGVARAHVVGHSLGGLVAFELGAAYPARVKNVVIASAVFPGPAPLFPDKAVLRAITRTHGTPRERAERNIRVSTAPDFEIRAPQLFQELVETLLTRPQSPEVYRYQTRAGIRYVTRNRISQGFSGPVTLLYGAADGLTLPATAEAYRSAIPQARARIMPGAGHLLPMERPEAFAAAVLEALDTDKTAR